MKKIFYILLVFTITIFVSSCQSDDGNNTTLPTLTLIADNYSILDGETINFTVYENGIGNGDITLASTIMADGIAIPNNGTHPFVFVSNKEGTNTTTSYRVKATKNTLFSAEITVVVHKTGIKLAASKQGGGILYEGDAVTFSVIDTAGENVTEKGTTLTIKYTKEDGTTATTILENKKDFVFDDASSYPGNFSVEAEYKAPNGTIARSVPLLININRKYEPNSSSYIDLVTATNTFKNVLITKVEVIHNNPKDIATISKLSSEYTIKITGNDNKITSFTIQLENPLSSGAIPILNTGNYAYIPLGTGTGFSNFSYDVKIQDDLTEKGKEATLNITSINLEERTIKLVYETGLTTSGSNQAVYQVNYTGAIVFTTIN